MFRTALFTTARTWKQPKCPSAEGWITEVVYIHSGILLSRKKGKKNAICSNMDATRDYHTKRSKSEIDKYRMLYHLYVESKI